MAWKRGKSWNRSFMGRKGGRQPERSLYLRTLANLTNPSEVRGVLQIGRKKYHAGHLTSDLLIFAHRILRQRYQKLSVIGAQARDLLFAEVEGSAEGVILGVLDVLRPRLGLRHEDFVIGRNAGRNEFPSQVRTLGKFGKLKDFVFVLDGDSRDMKERLTAIAEDYGHSVQPLFLPGTAPPEGWIWEVLQRNAQDYAALLGLASSDMERQMQEIARMLEGAVHRQHPAKANLEAFASEIGRSALEIGRIVGKHETERRGEGITEFLVQLEEQIDAWRRL